MTRAGTLTRARRATQAAVLLSFLLVPVANGLGMREVAGTLASLRLGPVDLTEPAAALAAALADPRGAALGRLALGVLPAVLLAVVLGPVFCAWICPFGLLSELLDRLLPWRRRFRAGAARRDRVTRPAVLAAALAVSAVLSFPLAAVLQGPRAVTVAFQEAVYLGAPSAFALALLGLLVVLEIVLPRRLFCRALCPAGTVAKLLRTPRALRVVHDARRCACLRERCVSSCPWGEDPRRLGPLDGCTRCGACVEVCPSGALRFVMRAPGTRAATPSPPIAGAPPAPPGGPGADPGAG